MSDYAKAVMNPDTPIVQIDENAPEGTVVKVIYPHGCKKESYKVENLMVVQVPPVWARADTIKALTGISYWTLVALVNNNKVRARKTGESQNCACVFRVSDVLECLDNDFPPPPPFKMAMKKKKEGDEDE